MNRGQFKQYILETYPCEANHPWIKYPNNEVFRHPGNRKWFALVMDVPKNKLGLAGSDVIDVVNLKCDPILIGSVRDFRPASTIADLPGDCYTVIIKGQERHLFFERADRMFPSRFGRWFVEV